VPKQVSTTKAKTLALRAAAIALLGLGALFFEATPPPAHQVQTLIYKNLMYGEGHGVEVHARWKVLEHWSFGPGFTYANEHMHTRPPSLDTITGLFEEGGTPNHMAQLFSHVDFRRGLTWDLNAYYVDELKNQGPAGNVKIPSYTRLDTVLTWRMWERFSFSLAGQNLLKDHHVEFEDMNGSLQSCEIK
jgi:outer membrane receptor for monomeric catechols